MSNIEDILSGKERLKFGDKKQIKAINERKKELEKNLYSVVIHGFGNAEYEVRADNEEDAREWAREKLEDYDISVELIEEGNKP